MSKFLTKGLLHLRKLKYDPELAKILAKYLVVAEYLDDLDDVLAPTLLKELSKEQSQRASPL